MNFCAKCLQEVGDNAVFLRNGTYMCPGCYQRAYPVKAPPPKAKRIDISVEGVVTIVVVAGVLLLGYKAVDYFQRTSHDAAVQAAKEKQENEVREKERQETAEREGRERAIADALAREKAVIAKQAELEALRVAAAAEKQKAEELRAQAEALALQKIKNPDIPQNEAARFETPEQRRAAALAKARATKLGDITLKVAALHDKMVKVPFKTEDERHDVERSLAGHKTMLEAAKASRDQALAKFRANFPAEYGAKGEAYWSDIECPGIELPEKKNFLEYTYEKFMDLRRLAIVLNKALADVRLHTAQVKLLSVRVDGYGAPSLEVEAEFNSLRDRLARLDATPEEIDATGINGFDHSALAKSSSTGTGSSKKSIVLKNGTVIPVKSFIILDTEITYTDTDGQPNTVSKDLVEKTVR